ncbi:general odorant-binding protein 71 [Copidosoma floridanum]|uniref:general odorant-binding protein 71 n=1 Tax=Copidosoma floridanum TaxID=29053 RepID=UPI0006C9D63D|nr:general odorant-binding protein 71 [Copidosoma floridanum]
MKITIFVFVSCLFYSTLNSVLTLKCRTGNQQSDDQFQKIIQICRRRYLGYDRETGYNLRRTDSQESDSDSEEDMFDRKFLTAKGNRYNYNNKNDNSGSSGRSSFSSRDMTTHRNWNNNNPSYNNRNNTRSPYDNNNNNFNNRHQVNYNSRRSNNNNMDSRGYSDNYSISGSNNNNNYNYNNNDDDREQACVVQCFFNELNLVDQRGFPERSSVVNIMTQNIQDSELRDFVEESVIECYHMLNNSGRQEKCQFSQNLLSCLTEKASERCEDWEDE